MFVITFYKNTSKEIQAWEAGLKQAYYPEEIIVFSHVLVGEKKRKAKDILLNEIWMVC